MRSAISTIVSAVFCAAILSGASATAVMAQTTAPQLAPSTNPQVETLLQGAFKLQWSNREAEADRDYKAAVALAERITDPVQRGELPRALEWQQAFFRHQKRYAEAAVAGERSLRLYEERFGKDEIRSGNMRLQLAVTAMAAGDSAKADIYFRQVLSAYDRDQSSERGKQAASAALSVAVVLAKQGRAADAANFQKRAIEIAAKVVPPDNLVLAQAYVGLGRFHDERKESTAAGAAFESGVKAAELAPGQPGKLALADALLGRAAFLARERRIEEARAAAQRALALREEVQGQRSAGAMEVMIFIGRLSSAGADGPTAERDAVAARGAYARNPNIETGRAAAEALQKLAVLQRAANRFPEAERTVWDSIRLREAVTPNDFSSLAAGYRLLAELRLRQEIAAGAEAAFKKAIELYGKAGTQDGGDIASMYVQMGDAQFIAGRYREAAESQQRGLFALPPASDPLILAGYQVRLASTFRYLRRYEESEAMARRALAAREAKFGNDGPLVGEAVFALAAALRWQGRYAEAEPLYRRALTLREKVFGPGNQHTLADRYGLALSVEGAGRIGEAEAMLRQLLADRERALGADHRDVADTIVSLVWNLRRQGRFAEAAAIADRPLKIYVAALGPDHPTVVSGIMPLATIHQDRSEFDQADKLLREVLRIRAKAYGAESIPVADTYGSLLVLSLARRQFEQATDFATKRLRISERVYGLEGAQLIGPLVDMQQLKAFTGDVNEVNALARRILGIAERHFGRDSLNVALASMDVAYSYRLRGMFGDVVDHYLRPLAIFTKKLGPRHPLVADALNLGASVLIVLGKAKEAEASFDDAISIFAEAYGKDSPALAGVLNNKALLLFQLHRYDEAESLLKKSIELLQKGAGKPTVNLATSMINLSLVYQERGKKTDADKLRQEAVGILTSLYGPNRVPPLLPAPILPQRTQET